MTAGSELTGLILVVPGAAPEDIQSGLAAAMAVLRSAGLTASQASRAAKILSECPTRGAEQALRDDAESWAARVWRDARQAALEACGRSLQDGGRLIYRSASRPDQHAR